MLDLFKIEAFQNSEEIRSEQALFLLDNSSLFGSGLAVVPNGSLPYLRSDMTPWVFELTYLQLIYNLGWLFFGFVALLLAHFYYKNIKKGDHFLSLSFLQGAFSILVVAWTNPYISNFETIILLFLVLILPPPSPKFYQGVKL